MTLTNVSFIFLFFIKQRYSVPDSLLIFLLQPKKLLKEGLSFFILQGYFLLIKRKLFNFAKILRTSFLQSVCIRLLLLVQHGTAKKCWAHVLFFVQFYSSYIFICLFLDLNNLKSCLLLTKFWADFACRIVAYVKKKQSRQFYPDKTKWNSNNALITKLGQN